MSIKPTFGGSLQPSIYYIQISSFVSPLRDKLTLKAIGDALNNAGFRTPSGLLWNKVRLANFLKTVKHEQ